MATSAFSVIDYLPAVGTAGPLNTNLLNPTSSSSGAFGGEVTALKLNIDFSDAGFLLGTKGIPFGDLILANFSTLPNLNGLTVRQFLGDANTALGGGSSIYSIADPRVNHRHPQFLVRWWGRELVRAGPSRGPHRPHTRTLQRVAGRNRDAGAGME